MLSKGWQCASLCPLCNIGNLNQSVACMLQFWFSVGRAQSIVLQRLFADVDNDESLAWTSLLALGSFLCAQSPKTWKLARGTPSLSARCVCALWRIVVPLLALSVKGYQVVGRVSLPVSFALIKKPSTTRRDTFSGVCTHPLTPVAANLFNNASLLTMIT